MEDEAAWLLERVRVGDLSQETLALAARCGAEGAAATGESPEDYGTLAEHILAVGHVGCYSYLAAGIARACKGVGKAPHLDEAIDLLLTAFSEVDQRPENASQAEWLAGSVALTAGWTLNRQRRPAATAVSKAARMLTRKRGHWTRYLEAALDHLSEAIGARQARRAMRESVLLWWSETHGEPSSWPEGRLRFSGTESVT